MPEPQAPTTYGEARKAAKLLPADKLVQYLYMHEMTTGDTIGELVYSGYLEQAQKAMTLISAIDLVLSALPAIIDIEEIKEKELAGIEP